MLSCLMVFAQTDSTNVSTLKPEYDFMYHELFNFQPNSTFGELKFQPEAPLLNLNLNLNQGLVIDYNLFSGMQNIRLSNYSYINPFINSFSITNQGYYKLNDKLMMGGNSFAGNSIYNPLPVNSSIQEMSIRGATMFLQYKISKNVRVGGGVSISNQDALFIP